MEAISRRKFIQLSSVTGTFLVVGCVPGNGKTEIVSALTEDLKGTGLNQFISIGMDNSIILFNHRPEMGQGTFTSIPMILAEELDVNMDRVKVKQSEADRELYGSQMVVGSRSIQTEFEKMRTMGAAAREMLMKAAAEIWKVDVASLKTEDGKVISENGDSLTYGELVESAAQVEAPQEPKLKDPADFKIIGTPVMRYDIPLKTNGAAKYGIDMSVPGMLHATIVRSPQFLGTVESYNEEEVLAVPGVTHVIKTSREVYGSTREGVAVLAESYWAALQGRNKLKISWDTKGHEKVSSESLLKDYYEESNKQGDELYGKGDALKVLKGSANVIEASYETPYQAHVPMEPMNAIVSIEADKAEFWGSTQNPNGIRSFLAGKYNIDESAVKVNYTFMGGGFGRRSMTDVAEEAADLSSKTGKPVKVVWTREDDQTQGPFRAASLNVCRAVMNSSGKIEALEHKVVAQEIRNQTGDNMKAGGQLMGGINTDYLIPNYRVIGVLQKRHIPISYWRAVYHSTNPFAHESFIDELAVQAGKDPIQFRLDMLEHPRYRRVLEEALNLSDWNSPKPDGTGRGVAVVTRSGAYFAMIAEVKRTEKGIVPTKFTTILDLGICINPDTVKAQTEGSIVMGLGAMYSGLSLDKGAIVEQNFHTYPLLRIDQCPEIVTHILESTAPPDGAGESGLPTVAPALANAIFDLTGKRLRKLPFDISELS